MPDFAVIYFNDQNQSYEFVKGPNDNQTFTAVDGTDANGQACLASNKMGKFVAFNTSGPNAATYQTAFETPNSDLVFTAWVPGTNGNNIRIRYQILGINQALAVSVSTNDITVNLGTNASGVPSSTASQIRTALNNSGPASALINVTFPTGQDGSGVPESSFAFRNLQYGSSGAAIASVVEQIETTSSSPTTF